jgi:DNA helicase II / ATP-dependent DNA helicase PcrA
MIAPTLNPQQLEAVNANEERILALAGAGSGKTSILTHRIARLVSKGVKPEEIMAVTFTKKAAEEMRDRIAVLLIQKNININPKQLVMGTFHSIFNEVVLSKVCNYFHRTPSYKIIDEDDKARLLTSIIKDSKYVPLMDEYNQLANTAKPDKILLKKLKEDITISVKQLHKDASAYIEAAKSLGYLPNSVPFNGDFDYPKKRDCETSYTTLLNIFYDYESTTLKHNVFDFDDLMLLPYVYLTQSKNQQMIDALRKPFKHYLVDEFQDTSVLQYKLISFMAENANLFIVGDDDQSLYSFRNADVRNIMDFSKNHQGKTYRYVVLDRNYRSEGNILATANSVISHNTQRLGKNLWTDSSDGVLIPVHSFDDSKLEAKWIASEIQKRIAKGVNINDIAILYRINRLAKPISLELDRLRIPYEEINGYDFFKRQEVKTVLGYLKLISNPNMFFTEIDHVINIPQKNIGDISLEKIKRFMALKINDFFENNRHLTEEFDLLGNLKLILLEDKDSEFYLVDKTKEGLKGFIALMNHMFTLYRKHTANKSIVKVSDLVIELTNFSHDDEESMVEYFKDLDSQQLSEDDMGRVENIEKLIFKMDDNDDLNTNLNNLLLTISGTTKNGKPKQGVKLMTVHGAKGLEFHSVFIAGVKNGLFPISNTDNMEEERRIFYVAVTRAKKECIITYSTEATYFTDKFGSCESPFIKEINGKLLVRKDKEPKNKSSQPQHPNPMNLGKGNAAFEMWKQAQKYTNTGVKK